MPDPIPPPKHLGQCFGRLSRVRPKTVVQGGRALRRRWKDDAGLIYEWDSRHGDIEKYSKRGNTWASTIRKRAPDSRVPSLTERWSLKLRNFRHE